MNQTSRILSFIDRNIADELDQLIPPDQQSKFVSQAIANELAMHRRNMVVTEMLENMVENPSITAISRRAPGPKGLTDGSRGIHSPDLEPRISVVTYVTK